MSGGSGTNNSWTILTSEETAAETLRPLAEGTEHHEGSHTSAAEGAVPSEGLPAEDHPVSEEKTTEPSGDKDVHKVSDASTPDIPIPTSLEVVSSFVPDSGSRSDDLPEATAQTSADPDSFSDSYTHISPSPDESPASPLSTETLGGLESIQEEERLTQEGTQHPMDGEELQQEGGESELSQGTTDLGKETDSLVDSEAGEERLEKKGEEGQEEVRRRRPLLAALERIGRTEEEEDEEEEFQVPQREEDSGLSLNKCILGAVILLGLGTIFFSESDYGARGLKDSEAPGKQDWLNPDVPPPAADADSTELLNKLAEGNQHITELQAQLQAQKEELKVAKGQAAEGAKERLQWEEVEKENSRLKKMMASLPVLQKENERMKRELESVPALQKELERLTSTVTELKLSSAAEVPVKAATSPSSGQTEHSRHSTADPTEKQARKPWNEQKEGKKKDWKKDKYDTGEKKEWREGEKSEWKRETKARKDGGKAEGKEKEWKKGKTEHGRFDKEMEKEGKHKKHSEEPKQWKGKEKEWKKDKTSRGDEGKPWKDREGKNERMEKSEKDWKKSKHDKLNEGKEWRDKEQRKEWKSGKDHGEWQRSKDEWRGEKEWKKAKDGFKDSGKEKYEKKDQKEKGEKKEWKKDSDWKSKNGKDNSKEWRGQGERKHESKNHDKEWKEKDERRQRSSESKTGKDEKEWKRKDERKQRGNDKRLGEEVWKEKKHNAEWKKDKSSFRKHTEELKNSGDHDHDEEHLWEEGKPPHSHRRPSPDQPEYWVHKRDHLQHSTRPQQTCTSTEACAQADGVRPVHFSEFQTTLQTYLSKAEEAGVDVSTTDELRKLAAEFFKDGLFVHDQMSFQDYVEDLGDILEDMVEEDENEEEEDSAIEDEMEGFELEVMQKFSVPGAGEEEKIKGEWRKESERGRG